ncbi:MAG: NAD(P)H-hydrate dehydratase [Bacteroidia bacterium]|nr:NAD(P)H-hydrate dehydratase [Bacteroidia bacterium]
MKILNAAQIKELDAFTIQHEPVSSLDLMERASRACVNRIAKIAGQEKRIFVFCGMGNNGGDGLAITRLLLERDRNATALIIRYSESFSPDAEKNYERLKENFPEAILEIKSPQEFPEPEENIIVIDALLGTGINKSPEGLLAQAIYCINKFPEIISIDLPSGLYPDISSTENKNIVRSGLTLTFQAPKLSFLMPENFLFVPAFEILDIGLHPIGLASFQTQNYFVTAKDVSSLLKPRTKFSHKGSFGHALLASGSKGKSGAAVISAKACLRSGAGYLTVHSNKETLNAVLQHLPEAMGDEDEHQHFISGIDSLEKYDAIAFGPGTGMADETQRVLKKILQYYPGKLIIDADGLNILAENKTWLSFLPADTILTPHPKEFERLTEKADDNFHRLTILKNFALKHRCIVVLKGAHTAIAMPDGTIFFNSTGNPGMAKAGSGDGLTGIILGLLARGYNAPQASLIGTYVHGMAADLCVKKKSMESLLISDVIEKLPSAFRKLESLT